jgi:hypothetical protein
MPRLDPVPKQQREFPRRADDLDISTSEDGCVISRPGQDRIHFLNPTAVLILELCDGEKSFEAIVELVQEAYNLPDPPADDVREVLSQLMAEGLLV